MVEVSAQDEVRAYIARLEEALAEYALQYGMTERARVLFQEGAMLADGTRLGRRVVAGDISPSVSACRTAQGMPCGPDVRRRD